MIVGILQFELHVPWAESLKDKRRVVKSVKDRLHREHMVSIAETAAQEIVTLAVLGLAAVGNDGQQIGRTLDRITEKLRALDDAELGEVSRELLRGKTAAEIAESMGETLADAEARAEADADETDHDLRVMIAEAERLSSRQAGGEADPA